MRSRVWSNGFCGEQSGAGRVFSEYFGFPELLLSLLNVHRVSADRQTEIHAAEPLIPDPSPFEVESAVTKLKRYKSPGCDQISAELIQAGGQILRS